MSTQREVLEGQTGSHRAKRANFGRGVRGSSPGKFPKPTWQMVQSGTIQVNLNKSGVDLASRVTIFNAVVFVIPN